HAIEQRRIMRVGGRRSVTIDVRFVSATNRDLRAEISKDRFRRDLFYRLAGIVINIPPLRERPWEIRRLAEQFAAEAAASVNRAREAFFSDEVLRLPTRYSWPGNIRELRNTIEQAVLLCDGDTILLEQLPAEIRNCETGPAPSVSGEADAASDRPSG